MRYFLLSFVYLVVFELAFAQDKPLSYTKTLSSIPLNNDQIFDKVLLWFGSSFFNDKDVIKVKNRNTGIIRGNAVFYSGYKVPINIKDSVNDDKFVNYNFEWTIRVINNHVHFSIPEIYINQKILVTTAKECPVTILAQSDEKTDNEWGLAKAYLIKNLNGLMENLNYKLLEASAGRE